MKSYCLKCKKDTKNIHQILVLVKQWYYQNVKYATVKIQDLLKIKKQNDYLGLRTPLSKVPLLGDILFWVQLRCLYEMNEIVNNTFLLAGDKFMSDMHLKQPGVTYSARGPFTKNRKRIQKFKQTGDTKYIYKNELDKACFQHDMAYGDFKDLARRTASDKVLRDKAFNIAKNPKYDGYQGGITSMVDKFFDKKEVAMVFLSLQIMDN